MFLILLVFLIFYSHHLDSTQRSHNDNAYTKLISGSTDQFATNFWPLLAVFSIRRPFSPSGAHISLPPTPISLSDTHSLPIYPFFRDSLVEFIFDFTSLCCSISPFLTGPSPSPSSTSSNLHLNPNSTQQA